ncbi:hypothetical protein [Nocardia sp. NPDC056000]|uniref:phthiocerol/phthiodiolone dimycocerosyl transferase family protein n=1 Tax=Nocardia sp. NPDC056000 TaxID=3345674 RepID=UPI0035E0D201
MSVSDSERLTTLVSPRVRRPLSAYEHGFSVIHEMSPLNVTAWARVHGRVPEKLLTMAAARAVAAHPLLRVRVAPGNGTGRWFEPVADPVLPIRIVRANPGSADAAADEIDSVELTTPIDQRTAPLVRMVDVIHAEGTSDEAHDLILTGAHLIVDATALIALLREIITTAAGFRDDTEHPALPSPYDLVPSRARGLGRTAAIMLADQIVGAIQRPTRLPVDDWTPIRERRTRLLRRTIDGERIPALLAACRRERTTVHGALTAALAGAVGTDLPGRTGRVTIGSAVNLRTDLRPAIGAGELGSYVTDLPGHIAFGPNSDFWESARAATRNIKRRRSFGQHLSTLAAARILFPPRWEKANRRVVTLLDRQGPFGVGLSNLGPVEFPDRVGAWQVSDAQFTASIPTGRIGCSVTTGRDALYWNFGYVEGLIATERAERLADEAVTALLAASEF